MSTLSPTYPMNYAKKVFRQANWLMAKTLHFTRTHPKKILGVAVAATACIWCNKKKNELLMLAAKYGWQNLYRLRRPYKPRNIQEDLRKAIVQHDERAIKILIANPEFQLDSPFTGQDETPLMLAAQQSTLPIVRDIFSSCLEYDYQNKQGRNVLLLPITNGTIFEFLVQNLPFVGSRDNNGQTVLMNAIRLHGNNRNIIETILAKKINIDAQDSEGQTALMMAAELNNERLVEQLLAHGAKKELTDRHNRTAYDFARQAKEPRPLWSETQKNRRVQQLLASS